MNDKGEIEREERKLENDTRAALLRTFDIEARRWANSGVWDESPVMNKILEIWRLWPVIKQDDVEFIQRSLSDYYNEKMYKQDKQKDKKG